MRNAFRRLARTLVGSRLRTNIVASGASTVVTAGIALVGYPLYLGYLGFESYGIWLSLSVINSVAQLGNTGFAPAVTKFVAEDLARGAIQRMTSCVSTAMILIILLGMFTIIMSVVFSAQIGSLFGLTGPALTAGEYYLPWIATLSTYTLAVQIRSAALVGLGRADFAAMSTLGGRVAALGVTWALLTADLGLGALLVGQFIGGGVNHIATLFWTRRESSIPWFLPPAFSRKEAHRLVVYGRSIMGNSVMQLLLQPVNRLLLARYAGVSSVPIFEVAWGGAMQIRAVPTAALQVLLPDFSGATARGDGQRVRGLLKKAYRVILLSAPLFAIIGVLTPVLLHLWLRDAYLPEQTPAFRVMLVGALISLISVPAYFHLLGIGKPANVFVSHALQSGINVIVALMFVHFELLSPFTLCLSALLGIAASATWLIIRSADAAKIGHNDGTPQLDSSRP